MKNKDLDGSVPDKSGAALLIIDMINDLEFDDGPLILDAAEEAARQISELKERCKKAGIPCLYVNDNFGRWKSNFSMLVDRCLHEGVRGEQLARLLKPEEKDYFVLKPRHSGFYSSALEILLKHLGTRNLLITGITTDICVYFTASDAYMRGYNVFVPSDCSAAVKKEWHEEALSTSARILKADVSPQRELRLDGLARLS